MDELTSDTLHLSEPKKDTATSGNPPDEVNFTGIACSDPVIARFVSSSLATATKRAYLSDLAHFLRWGGGLPTKPETVARYLADHAECLSSATLSRRLSSLAKSHRAMGADDPCKDELVQAVLRGIKRLHGRVQAVAEPLLRDDLLRALEAMGDDLRSSRDRALLLVGFAGAFRRSELIGLQLNDCVFGRQGLTITLRRSKTDQLGQGRQIGIPYGRSAHCPVKSLLDWLDCAQISEGPLFRPINKHGGIASRSLSGEAVSIIVKKRLLPLGLDVRIYSGHSLRAGFATSAAIAGGSGWQIRTQTGHRSDAMLNRYIRNGCLFRGSAVSLLL